MSHTHQFICFLSPARPGMPDDPTDAEAAAVAGHADYYASLRDNGTLIIAGRTQRPPYRGILVFEAESLDDARRIVDADPAISQRVMLAEVHPFKAVFVRGGV